MSCHCLIDVYSLTICRTVHQFRIKNIAQECVVNSRWILPFFCLNFRRPNWRVFLIAKGLRYKNLGKSGLRVSNVALGTWSVFSSGITDEQAETIVKLAYESGINLFDLSDLHSGPRAEIEMGNIIKKMNWKRMTYVVTVKIYWSIK